MLPLPILLKIVLRMKDTDKKDKYKSKKKMRKYFCSGLEHHIYLHGIYFAPQKSQFYLDLYIK